MELCLRRFTPPLLLAIVLTLVVGASELCLCRNSEQQVRMADPWQLRELILLLRCRWQMV